MVMGCSPLSPGANIVSRVVLSCLSLLPFLIKIILPVMCDFDHIYTCLSEDICRYVSKDMNFQFIKCNTHVGISIYTFAFSIHFLTFLGGIQHFPSHPQQQPVHEFGRYCARGKSAFSLTPTTTARPQIIILHASAFSSPVN